ncbi:MAG: hypothetical protein AABZ53_03440, partial [Planctomycetota bacterium]
MGTRRSRFLWLLPLLVTIGITIVTLRWSLQFGRLSMTASYDDVTYLAESLSHVHRLKTQGLGTFASELIRLPPHSPLMFVCGLIGFLCIGLHDWAPYTIHAGVLLLSLVCVSWMARHAGWIARSALVLAAALLPISLQSILEFRPAAAASLFTAFGCIFIIDRLPTRVWSSRGLRIVALASLALLAKPSVFPATLALFGLACALSISAERLSVATNRAFRPVRSLILASFRLLGTTALFVSPHYLIAGPKIVRYIAGTLFGSEAAVWSFGSSRLSLAQHFLYYLKGERKLIGWPFFPGLALGIAILVVALAWGTRRVRFQSLAIAGMVLATYLIVSINKTKTPFLGLTFFAFLTVAVFAALAHVATSNRLKGRPLAAAALPCGVLLLAIIFFRVPLSPIQPVTAITRATDSAIRDILSRTIEHAKETSSLVFIPHVGQLNAQLLELEALKAGVVLRAKTTPFETDPAVYSKWFDASQMVIIADPHADMISTGFPVTTTLTTLRSMLDLHPDFALAFERTTPSGGRFSLFIRRPGSPVPPTAPQWNAIQLSERPNLFGACAA